MMLIGGIEAYVYANETLTDGGIIVNGNCPAIEHESEHHTLKSLDGFNVTMMRA